MQLRVFGNLATSNRSRFQLAESQISGSFRVTLLLRPCRPQVDESLWTRLAEVGPTSAEVAVICRIEIRSIFRHASDQTRQVLVPFGPELPGGSPNVAPQSIDSRLHRKVSTRSWPQFAGPRKTNSTPRMGTKATGARQGAPLSPRSSVASARAAQETAPLAVR